jgi:hypothetical protein
VTTNSLHERFDREEQIRPSSNRTFGLLFAGIFTLLGVLQMLKGRPLSWGWLAAAVTMAAVAVLRPAWLSGVNRAWVKLSLLLFHVVNPIVLAVMFATTILPIGLLMRLSGRDELKLKSDKSAKTYWIERSPPGPAADSMRNQF